MAMPGTLPATSGYTYAVELSVDQALAAAATRVDFDQAVPFYLENFLKFPVGMAVPAGYYDRGRGLWVPSENGRVIEVVSESAGLASLDVDGDGVADSSSVLAGLGVTDAERAKIASLYEPGESLWRVPIEHFTPWDCNWPYRASQRSRSAPRWIRKSFKLSQEDVNDNQACGSIIQVEDQALDEVIPIAGTPFSLVYSSDRVLRPLGREHAHDPAHEGNFAPRAQAGRADDRGGRSSVHTRFQALGLALNLSSRGMAWTAIAAP